MLFPRDAIKVTSDIVEEWRDAIVGLTYALVDKDAVVIKTDKLVVTTDALAKQVVLVSKRFNNSSSSNKKGFRKRK